MRFDGFHGSRKFPREQITVDGTTYEVETNGQALVLVRVASSALPMVTAAKRVATFEEYARATAPTTAVETNVGELSKALRPAEYPVDETCGDCNGTGQEPDADGDCTCTKCRCETCDGSGTFAPFPDLRPSYVLGAPLNANLVAVALEIAASSGDCAMWRHVTSAGPSLIVSGSGWRVGVMCTQPWEGGDRERAICIRCGGPDEAEQEIGGGR